MLNLTSTSVVGFVGLDFISSFFSFTEFFSFLKILKILFKNSILFDQNATGDGGGKREGKINIYINSICLLLNYFVKKIP